MATTTTHHQEGGCSMKENRIGIATLRFQNRKYQFPSIIIRNNGKQQCIMLDVCLLCPFCTGDINARIIPLESRVLLAQGQNRHSYPPAGPDVVMQCEDLATSFARQFPHLLSPQSRHHLTHCNVADRLSQSADASMMTQSQSANAQIPQSTRLKVEEAHRNDRTEHDDDTFIDNASVKTDDSDIPKPRQTLDALDSADSDANAEGDSTQTSDTDSVDSVRYLGEKYSTVKRAFPHDVIRGIINESAKEESEPAQPETVKRSPKPPMSPRSSPKQKKRGSKSPFNDTDRKPDDSSSLVGIGERTTAVVVKSTIHQTVAELLDLPYESDGEETGADGDKPEAGKKVLSLDNIRSASQLSDYGSMESMSNSHERLRRSRSEGMGSMDSSLHSTRKVDAASKSEIKVTIGKMKELPESVTKEFVKLRSKVKKAGPDTAWSYDDLKELYKGAHVGSGAPFRHSQGDIIAAVYPVFDFRREASPRGRQEGDARQSPRTSQMNVASQSGIASTNVILTNQSQQLDVNANIDSPVHINVPTSQLRQEAAVNLTDDRDPDERGIEDAEKEMERVVGEMTSLEAELEQMYRMTAKSRQQRPPQEGGATNLGDSSTTLASLQERQRIEQEEIERMQELEDERRRPFVAEPKSDKKPNGKKEKQAKRMPREEAQFEEEERRVQLWLREQQKRQKILQKQNLTQQDRKRLQILNEQRHQQFLQERLRLQLEARNQQTQPLDESIPSGMSQEDMKRRQKIKEKLQHQAEQLHQLQMQALYQQHPANERQAEIQWQAIQEHHQRVLQEQAEIANQNANSMLPERKVKPPVPPKPTFGVPRVRNLAKKDETPPQVRRMRNVMSYLESSSQEALQDNQPKQSTTAQARTLESSTSSSAAESCSYQHLYEQEAMASLENEDLNFYDEENDRVIDRTGDINKIEEAECLIQDPEDVYAQHIQAKDISQMLDILERVVDGSKKRKKGDGNHSGSSSSDEEDIDISDRDPEETVDEILENIDTDSYSPNATLSRVFTTPRRRKAMMKTVEELESVKRVDETEDHSHEVTVDEVLESMEGVTGIDSSQLFESVIQAETMTNQEKETAEVRTEVVEESVVPKAAQFTADDLVPPSLEEKRSSSTECLPDDNTSLEMERSICYSENTSETTSYDEDSIDLQMAEANLSKESSAEIKHMIVKTTAMTDEIILANQQSPADQSEVRLRMLTPIMEERSNRSSAISSRSSGVLSDGKSPRSSDAMTDLKSNRSSAMSSDLLTDLSSDRRSSRSTDIISNHSGEIVSNRSSAVLSNRSSQALESPPAVTEDSHTPTWPQESCENQVPVQGVIEEVCVTPSKSEDSGDILIDESMLIEQMSRSASASPGDHVLLTSSESESGASLQRRNWSRNQHQLSPYAYEYGEAVGHEMREPVHIRLYPSVEDMMPHGLPPEQVDHQLTVMTDFLSLDNVFQEGKPALSPRSPQLFSPTFDDEFSSDIHEDDRVEQQIISSHFDEPPAKPDQMDIMVETTEKTEHMAVKEANLVIREEKSQDLQPPQSAVSGELVTEEEVSAAELEQLACYTVGEQNLNIIKITTEVNRKQLPAGAQANKTIQSLEVLVVQPDIVADIQVANQVTTKEGSQQMETAVATNTTVEVLHENRATETAACREAVVHISEVVDKATEAISPEEATMETTNAPRQMSEADAAAIRAALATMDSSSESIDISSEEDEITNVIELLHKVKKEYEAEIPKYEVQLSQPKVQEKVTEHEEKPPKSDSDSGSEVIIDESGSGEVFKIKLDRQSSLRFQKLSRENSLRDEVDDISEEYAFNMHVRSLERLASLSREAINVSTENLQSDTRSQKEETEGPSKVVQKEIEAINRLESLITVDSEPQTPEDIRYTPGLDDALLVDEFGVPLEMTCSMESIEEVDEKVEENEEDEIVKAAELEQSMSQISQLHIIIEEEDRASQDSKTSSPSKKSTDASEGTLIDTTEGALIDDNVSAETSSSFAISEGSNNSGQPDLLHNVIVCAGAMMKRGSDSDSIQIDSDSSSDGFGSMKASTLKIRMTDKKPPIHPATEVKPTSWYSSYGDIILGEDDREDSPEAEMAIFNFKQALAMFEGMTKGQGSEELTKPEELMSDVVEEEKDHSSSYVVAAVRSHEKFVEQATFGNRDVTEIYEDLEIPKKVTSEQVVVSQEVEKPKPETVEITKPLESEEQVVFISKQWGEEAEPVENTELSTETLIEEVAMPVESKELEEIREMLIKEIPCDYEEVPSASGTTEVETEVHNPAIETDTSENIPPTDYSNVQIIVSEAFEEEDVDGEILHVEVKVKEDDKVEQERECVTETDAIFDVSKTVTPEQGLMTVVQDTEVLLEDQHVTEPLPEKDKLVAEQVDTEIQDYAEMMVMAGQENPQDEEGDPFGQEIGSIKSEYISQEILQILPQENITVDIENVREISPIALAACYGVDVLTSLEKAEQKNIVPSCAGQLESPMAETVEALRVSSPSQPELLLHQEDLSTIQDVSQEESMVSESGELYNADSCAELSSRESETSDVTVISSSIFFESKDDLMQEPTRVEEIASPSPDQVSLLSSSEDVSAERLSIPAPQLSTSQSSQETSFVLERQESLSADDVRSLTPVPSEPVGEAVVQLHSPKKDLVDFENSLSSQEASFVLERNDSASDDDVRDITPVPDDNLDVVCEVNPKVSREVSHSSPPDILIADYDDVPSMRSDEDLDKRSTIDSQKSAISLIQAVSKSSDTEEVVTVSPDVTQISLLEQQAEYQRYKDDMSTSLTEQSSSSARSSMASTQEKFESYMDVSNQEVEMEVPQTSLNQQKGLVLMQPGLRTSHEKLSGMVESDSFDDLHRSPSFQRNKPRRSPSTSSSEKASMTYSQEHSFERSFDTGQPVTEWHAARTATYESKGNVLYHEESQISSDTEGSLRRKRKVLIKRPSADSNEYETQTFVKEDVSPSPVFQPTCNMVAVRTDSVSEGEEGDDEKELSASSSASGSREGSFIRYSSAEDVNEILDKVRAVVFEASKYQKLDSSQTETNEQSIGDVPDGSMSESGVGATEQDIKDYFINREDEELKKKQIETEEFLRNLLQKHHQDHVSKESTKKRNDVTDISACLEEVCRAMSESDSDEIVIEEDVQTQEVTLVFAWPKKLRPVFQYPDRPYREICMKRITKIRDFDIDIVEGPELETISASGSQSDSYQTEVGPSSDAQQPASSQDNNKPTASDSQQCQTED